MEGESEGKGQSDLFPLDDQFTRDHGVIPLKNSKSVDF